MLIDKITNYCDEQYTLNSSNKICENCTHTVNCSGSCRKCLKEIHFPNDFPDGKKDYDCKNLINHYVCTYIFKYASEIWYLLKENREIDTIKKYKILSVGCGACPDLMAFESYLNNINSDKQISYYGIDVNPLWKNIHEEIKNYNSNNLENVQFEYTDVIEYFKTNNVKSCNILVLQYVISHFYNTNQIDEIDNLFDNLINNVILQRNSREPFIIIINDVNSCNRGRNNFKLLFEKLNSFNLFNGNCYSYYFDNDIQHEKQRCGTQHKTTNILYDIPDEFNNYEPWKHCSSAQIIICIDPDN